MLSILAYLRRTIKVLALTLIVMPTFLVALSQGKHSGGKVLRWYFQTIGGGFLKIGQILAMRYDFLPLEFCEELSQLLDKIPPIATDTIIKIVEKDLQINLPDHFQQFSIEPIGSASIAQVHQARLINGDKVAVKVMRPDSKRIFNIDFFNARMMTRFIDMLGILGRLKLTALIEELIQLTLEELDFEKEAQNIQLFHEIMRSDKIKHCAPIVYHDLSAKATITMAFISGDSLQQYITAIENKDVVSLNKWEAKGITRPYVAELIMRSTLTMMFQHRVFQADPHAANLILMEDGHLAYIDFGMIGWLDEKIWKQQFRLRQNVANENIHAAYLTVLDMLDYVPERKLALFEMQIKGAIRDWVIAASSPHASIRQKSSGVFFLNLFNIVRKANLRVPLGVSRLFRTMLIADILMLRVDPTYDWMPTLQSFVNDQIQYEFVQSIKSGAKLSNIMTSFWEAGQAANQGFDFLNHLPDMQRAARQQPDSALNLVLQAILLSIKRIIIVLLAFIIIKPVILPANHPIMQFFAQMGSDWALLLGLIVILIMINHIMRLIN